MSEEKATDRNSRGTAWSEVISLQYRVRDLEKKFVTAYMTQPSLFAQLASLIQQFDDEIDALGFPNRCWPPCDPGWNCCCGMCTTGQCQICKGKRTVTRIAWHRAAHEKGECAPVPGKPESPRGPEATT